MAETGRPDRIVGFSWAATVLFVVNSALAVAVRGYRPVGAVIALLLFGVGVVAFLVAFFTAVNRSRYEMIGVGGLYFLAGCAPGSVRSHLLGALAVQVVVAFVAASLAPFTAVAFSILVPMLGLGLSGLWGARHGVFPAREPDPSAVD